mmetsp:Transcript_4708/g.13721  ORF Transcript_4708/g.13721 Transcript_4708/m.13721 type:complete len:274 (-) Transcript_4708:393-1214(-)
MASSTWPFSSSARAARPGWSETFKANWTTRQPKGSVEKRQTLPHSAATAANRAFPPSSSCFVSSSAPSAGSLRVDGWLSAPRGTCPSSSTLSLRTGPGGSRLRCRRCPLVCAGLERGTSRDKRRSSPRGGRARASAAAAAASALADPAPLLAVAGEAAREPSAEQKVAEAPAAQAAAPTSRRAGAGWLEAAWMSPTSVPLGLVSAPQASAALPALSTPSTGAAGVSSAGSTAGCAGSGAGRMAGAARAGAAAALLLAAGTGHIVAAWKQSAPA